MKKEHDCLSNGLKIVFYLYWCTFYLGGGHMKDDCTYLHGLHLPKPWKCLKKLTNWTSWVNYSYSQTSHLLFMFSAWTLKYMPTCLWTWKQNAETSRPLPSVEAVSCRWYKHTLLLVYVLWVMPQADVVRQLNIHSNTEQDLVLLNIVLLKTFKF